MSGEEKALACRLRKEGKTLKEVSGIMFYCEKTIWENTKDICSGNFWTENEIDALIELKSAGITYKEIAKMLGKTSAACKRKHLRVSRIPL